MQPYSQSGTTTSPLVGSITRLPSEYDKIVANKACPVRALVLNTGARSDWSSRRTDRCSATSFQQTKSAPKLLQVDCVYVASA